LFERKYQKDLEDTGKTRRVLKIENRIQQISKCEKPEDAQNEWKRCEKEQD